MKKIMLSFTLLSTILLFYTSSVCYGQEESNYLLKGEIKNYSHTYFEVYQEGYLFDKDYNIVIDKSGNFSMRIPIERVQNLYIQLNDNSIKLFAVPGDTIMLNWDEKDALKTFQAHCPDSGRDAELSYLVRSFKTKILKHPEPESRQTISDSVKFTRINTLYNAEINRLNQNGQTENFDKLVYDCYYEHMSSLRSDHLLEKFKLNIERKSLKDSVSKAVPSILLNYKMLNEMAFAKSEAYRTFLFDWLRLYNFFDGAAGFPAKSPQRTDFLSASYFLGKAVISIGTIRDWYLARVIKDGFDDGKFDNAIKLQTDFMADGHNPTLIAQLSEYSASLKNLSSGEIAPDFKLKDTNGKQVSLADFRGKLIYIDFWGVHCGPCRYDIVEHGAGVHDKYKNKDVVFVNICTDETEQPWRKAIADLKLTGVNLMVDVPNNSQVEKDYSINSIPRYVLINKDGRLISANAPGLWELINPAKNILDEQLQ